MSFAAPEHTESNIENTIYLVPVSNPCFRGRWVRGEERFFVTVTTVTKLVDNPEIPMYHRGMSQTKTVTKSYKKLLSDISQLIDEGRNKALEALASIRNQTYWNIGHRLSRAEETRTAQSTKTLLAHLARDLGLDSSVLYRALQFYRIFPDGLSDRPEVVELSWSAHSELLPIKDEDERAFYMKRAYEKGWSVRALRRAIRSNLFEAQKQNGTKAPAVLLDRPSEATHNYAAVVERVIDGDTLEARIDLGFDTWRVERIRLRGIDAPEMNTPQGKRSKAFVEQALKRTEKIVVHTYKTDVYARYVADVFYQAGVEEKDEIFTEGRFLNQEILDSGMGVVAVW